MNIVFRPNPRGTIAIAATNVPTSVSLPPGGGGIARVVNVGPGNCYVEFTIAGGQNASVPTTTPGSTPVVANAPASFFRLRPTDANVSVVSDSTSGLRVTIGQEI